MKQPISVQALQKVLACYRPGSFRCNKSTLIEKLKAACKHLMAIQIILAATIEEGIL